MAGRERGITLVDTVIAVAIVVVIVVDDGGPSVPRVPANQRERGRLQSECKY